MSKIYTKEQIEALKKYYPDSNYEELFKFFPDMTKREIRVVAHNHKIKSNNPRHIKDLTNQKFGLLTPIQYDIDKKKWKCLCDCGNIHYVSNSNLERGKKSRQSCGCNRYGHNKSDFIYEEGQIIDHVNSGKLKILKCIRMKPKNKKVNKKHYEYECLVCGHHDITDEYVIKRGSGCPVCAKQKLVVGINDIWTTDPEIAKLLANPQDGYENMRSTNKRLDWKCPDCGHIVKNRTVNQISSERHVSCPKCSDGVSYPNKFMYHILKSLRENFENEYSPNWIKPKRYDFALFRENEKYIIEMDGGLGHGRRSFNNEISQEITKEVDEYKDLMALKNGFKVIRIDCNYGSSNRFEYVKESICNSVLGDLLNLNQIDFIEIDKRCQKSIIKECCDLYNGGVVRTEDIAKQLHIHRGTATRYLNKGSRIGLCDYDPKKVKKRYRPVDDSYKYKAVKQYDLNMNYLATYESLTIASKTIGIGKSSISACCRGKTKTCGGYIWRFADDESELKPYKNGHYKPVVQIDTITNQIVATYPYIQDAYTKTGVCASCIGQCCKGKRKTAGGYIWRYVEEGI